MSHSLKGRAICLRESYVDYVQSIILYAVYGVHTDDVTEDCEHIVSFRIFLFRKAGNQKLWISSFKD